MKIKKLLNTIFNFLRILKTKVSVFVGKVEDSVRCRQCDLLQEQLDIERERFNSLLEVVTGKAPQEDEDESDFKETRPRGSWKEQQLRLVERSKKEYKEYLESRPNVQEEKAK